MSDAELNDGTLERLIDSRPAPPVNAAKGLSTATIARIKLISPIALVALILLLTVVCCALGVALLWTRQSSELANSDSVTQPPQPPQQQQQQRSAAHQSADTQHSAASSFSRSSNSSLLSSSRGYIAVLYSGTVRTFSVAFHSHLINLLAPSPYTVHIFAHYGSGRGDWKTPGVEHEHIALYRGFNATLRYFGGYSNLDNQYVSLLDDCLKWSRVDDTVDMESSARFNYTEALRLIGDRYDANSIPMSIVGALDSQRQVNRARIEYERENGIKYGWVVRVRMDHVMKSNVWEDVFDIQPLANPTATTAPPFLSPATHPSLDPYLDLSSHPHPPSVHSANFSSLGLSRPWNGGVLYDMRYTPHPLLSVSSDDQDSSFFVSTNDWHWGVTDQFAMGGSAAMTSYSERFNVPLIALLANEPNWKLWAEPLVAQVAIVDGLRVVPFRHVYNVLRHIATRPSSWKYSYTPSRCVWIMYGQQAMSDHCPYWLSRQQRMSEAVMAAANDTVDQQIATEPYANTGNSALRAISAYIDTINSLATGSTTAATATPNTTTTTTDSHTASPTRTLSLDSSNYYYFWRYRSAKQLLRCEQPERAVYPEIANSLEAVQPADHPPFDPYLNFHYPFITRTTDPTARSTYRQHITCQQQ